MYAFTYERPATAADAQKLAQAGGKLLAGGQTLLASMKLRLAAPEQLVDLAGIADLKGIRREAGTLTIGAMTRHCDVAESAEVRADIPALAELAGHIGDKQVRAMGTIGGSVANNDPAADYPAALMALGATVHTGTRQIKADDFFQGLFATALEDGELITAIGLPIPKPAAATACFATRAWKRRWASSSAPMRWRASRPTRPRCPATCTARPPTAPTWSA